ncbi:MAG: methyltransferase domain-containing protein [Acidimicrobiales bacterium]
MTSAWGGGAETPPGVSGSGAGTPMEATGTAGVALRCELVACLERRGFIRTAAVRDAFLEVPRELFIPDIARRDGLKRVYSDRALVTLTDSNGRPISSSSQPAIMAEMLEQLDLAPGSRVLEIGTGTGYNAALLACLVGPSGTVTSVELEPTLATAASAALRAGGYGATVIAGDAFEDLGPGAPYDRIIVTASGDHVPPRWRDAVVEGGLLELPLRLPGSRTQQVVTFRRRGDQFMSTAIVSGGFMTLRRTSGDPGPPLVAGLSCTEYGQGGSRVLVQVEGPGYEALGPAGRRRLAAVLLSRPRIRTMATPAPAASSLIAYLETAGRGAPTMRLVRRASGGGVRVGTGVVEGQGTAMAAAFERRGRPGCLLAVFGSGAAAEWSWQTLEGLVGRWQAAGCPTLSDCEITVSYGAAVGSGEPSSGATETAAGEDGVVTLRWPSSSQREAGG